MSGVHGCGCVTMKMSTKLEKPAVTEECFDYCATEC